MKNKKNGFTLVEVLASLAIIAAVGGIIVFSINKINHKANASEYAEKYREIFNAASIYSELSEEETDTSCDANACYIRIEYLINAGLLNKNILKERNPVYRGNTKFHNTDSITITRVDGKKIMIYGLDGCTAITSENYENYEWENC